MIKITKNIAEATMITHSGSFHPDDVFSTMFLSNLNPDEIVIRLSKLPDKLKENIKVYDIGFGKFDHHQPDAKMRNANIKYCSFGLLWSAYGEEYLQRITPDYKKLWQIIDEKLVMQIDAIDNGVFPKIEAEYSLLDLDKIIDLFNNAWNENEDNDENFREACAVADLIFKRLITKELAKIEASKIIEEIIEQNEGEILILPKYLPYQEAIHTSLNPKAKNVKVIIFPSNRGGYNIKPMTISKESKQLVVNFDKRFFGLHDEELVRISGIKTAKFVHNTGFIASTETLEDALLLAQNALDTKK